MLFAKLALLGISDCQGGINPLAQRALDHGARYTMLRLQARGSPPNRRWFYCRPRTHGCSRRADEAVRFQCDNPAGMDADGDEEVAGSLKGARQNQPGQEQVHRVRASEGDGQNHG